MTFQRKPSSPVILFLFIYQLVLGALFTPQLHHYFILLLLQQDSRGDMTWLPLGSFTPPTCSVVCPSAIRFPANAFVDFLLLMY